MLQSLEERVSDLWNEMRVLEPAEGKHLRFNEIARNYPFSEPIQQPSKTEWIVGDREVWMADFAEFGYCSYKAWHKGHGTEERRGTRTERALQKGIVIHKKILAEESKAAKKLRKATPAHLRDTKINLASIAEFPSRIREGGLVYVSRVERAGRERKNLVITEIKTSRYEMMPDHLLQVWGYCLSAPGGLVKAYQGNYRAQNIYWQLAYREAGE